MTSSRGRMCVHCKVRRAWQARRLCNVCHKRHRDLYPVVRDTRPKTPPAETEADLDRLIAAQMQCLPAWWGRAYPED